MSVDVDGCWDAWSENTRRARKDHECDACDCVIRRGDLYVVHSFVYEHTASSVKRCLRCDAIYQHLVELFREKRISDEAPDVRLDCGHEYRERWGVDPPPELAELAFMTPEEVQRKLAKEIGS